MIIGIPKEIKDNENRVGIIPSGVEALGRNGHDVVIEAGAGLGSGIDDREYVAAGARILPDAAAVYGAADMIMKVKEPLPPEYPLFKQGQILYTYLHLAPEPELTRVLLAREVIGIAYETVEASDGSLPLLSPMSEIAGRMSVQIGAQFLERPNQGKGILLGGVPGVEPAQVVIIGGGTVGTQAARMAVGLGANVTILDREGKRLRQLDDMFAGRITTIMSNSYNIAHWVAKADLLIGAVLLRGAKAPKLVTEAMVKAMVSGSVIVDVAIDQGGTIETVDHVTTHSDPVYMRYGVVHYAVANIPGAVARTSTFALANATIDYALQIANKGWRQAIADDPGLARGINVAKGAVTYEAVANALELPYTPLTEIL